MVIDLRKIQLNFTDGLIAITEVIVSIISFVITFDSTSGYPCLWILPVTFLISMIFGIGMYSNILSNITKLIISSGYFIKMVITPGLFALGGYRSFYKVSLELNSFIIAVLMMSFECFFVFLWCSYSVYTHEKSAVSINSPARVSKRVRAIIMLAITFLLFALIYVPTISSVYQPFYKISLAGASDLRWDTETIVARGSISRIIYSLFCYLWPIVRMILPVWLISSIMDKFGDRKITIFFSCFAFLTPFILISNDTGGPIVSVVIAAILLRRIYGKKTNRIFMLSFAVIGIVTIIMLLAKMQSMQAWRGGSGVSSLAQVLNAYFPGFENYTFVRMIENSNKMNTLFFDIYYIVPFKETLFGLHGDNLQALFTSTNLTGGQIMPLTAQVSHYITPILAPFFTVFVANIALKSEYKSKMSDSFWYSFLYIMIAVLSAISIHLYSFSTYINSLFNVTLPVYLIIRMATGRSRNNKGFVSEI